MPIEKGDYRELKAFENILDRGWYRILPSYTRSVLLLMIRHANFPSGWTWPGRKRMEKVLGLDSQYQMLGIALLAKLGLICKWGYMKTKGRLGLAYKLDLGVPLEQVPPDYSKLEQLVDDIHRQVKGSTYRCIEAYLSMLIGQPLDVSVVKEDITLKNPKEPSIHYFKEEEKKEVYKGQAEELKNAKAEADRILKPENVSFWKGLLMPEQYKEYKKYCLKRYPKAGKTFEEGEALFKKEGVNPQPV